MHRPPPTPSLYCSYWAATNPSSRSQPLAKVFAALGFLVNHPRHIASRHSSLALFVNAICCVSALSFTSWMVLPFLYLSNMIAVMCFRISLQCTTCVIKSAMLRSRGILSNVISPLATFSLQPTRAVDVFKHARSPLSNWLRS